MTGNMLELAKTQKEYPNISLIMPTHRSHPDNAKDPIRLKNLISEAKERLEKEFSDKQLEPIFKNLDRAFEIDLNHNKDGLVIFANKHFFAFEKILLRPRERVVINHSFATRDLVMAKNNDQSYYVLTLSKHKVRLLEGVMDNVFEVFDKDFPMVNMDWRATNFTREIVEPEEPQIRDFFHLADKAFQRVFNNAPAPLILAGVDRNISFFKEVSGNHSKVIGQINSSWDEAKPHEIVEKAWAIKQQNAAKQREELLGSLENAVGQNRLSNDINEIWRMVKEGNVSTLLIEEKLAVPGEVKGNRLILGEDNATDDVLDEIIEEVMDKSGRVVFVPDGKLKDHRGMALIKRY